MLNDQQQKGGDDSINQQANNGGINQKAGGDITNNIYGKPEQDLGIIAEIFQYIFDNKIQNINISQLKETEKVLQLKEKIEVNFENGSKSEINKMLTKNWSRIEIVEKYIQENNEISPERISALILKIQSMYKEKKSCDTSEEHVQNVSVIEDISKEFVPENKKVHADYYAGSLAIVLYFFQMCEIGKRTNAESAPLTLFE